MARELFEESRNSIPKSDPKVERIEFDKEDIGARKSHISGLVKKNSYTIRHVEKG